MKKVIAELKTAIVGARESGKTCFLAGLKWMSDVDSNFIGLQAEGDVQQYLCELYDGFRMGKVPSSSDNETELVFAEQYGDLNFSFTMWDFPGEKLRTMSSDDPVFTSWVESDYLIILLDIDRDLNDMESQQDIFDVLSRPDMHSEDKRVAVLLTKADKFFISPGRPKDKGGPLRAKDYLRGKSKLIFDKIENCNFKVWDCFYVASIGKDVEKTDEGIKISKDAQGNCLPSPWGYKELFAWLTQEVMKKKVLDATQTFLRKAKPWLLGCAGVFVAVLLFECAVAWRHQAALKVAVNPHATKVERAKATWQLSDDDRVRIVEMEIDKFDQQAQEARTRDAIREFVCEYKVNYFDRAKLSDAQAQRVREMVESAKERVEESYVAEIDDCDQRNDDTATKQKIKDYFAEKFTSRSRHDHIKEVELKIKQKNWISLKDKIANALIGSDYKSTVNVKAKLNLIKDYIKNGEKSLRKEDCDDMNRAVEVMQKLIDENKKEYLIKKVYVGSLKDAQKTYVLVRGGSKIKNTLKAELADGTEILQTDHKEGPSPQWNDGEIKNSTLKWEPGELIRVEWWRDDYAIDDKIANRSFAANWTTILSLLSQRVQLNDTKEFDFDNGPWLSITCDEFPDAKRDLECVEKYIVPGTFWR